MQHSPGSVPGVGGVKHTKYACMLPAKELLLLMQLSPANMLYLFTNDFGTLQAKRQGSNVRTAPGAHHVKSFNSNMSKLAKEQPVYE